MSKNVHYIMTLRYANHLSIDDERQEHKVTPQEGESPGAAAMRDAAEAEMVKGKGYDVDEWKQAGVCQTDDGWLLSCFVASIIDDPRHPLPPSCVHVAVKY